MRKIIPLKDRPADYIYIGFFLINVLFITYIVDLEQLVIADPSSFDYPFWPLPFLVDMTIGGELISIPCNGSGPPGGKQLSGSMSSFSVLFMSPRFTPSLKAKNGSGSLPSSLCLFCLPTFLSSAAKRSLAPHRPRTCHWCCWPTHHGSCFQFS